MTDLLIHNLGAIIFAGPWLALMLIIGWRRL